MGLSLKKEKMIEYLERAKMQGESFRCMLWGTVFADLPILKNRSAVSVAMLFTLAPGVSGTLNNAFCYIGLTEKCLYVIALDAYNTSNIIGTFSVPFTHITSINLRKTSLGASHTVEVEYGGFISLTVKGISLGTNISDQKERMKVFLAAIEDLQKRISG